MTEKMDDATRLDLIAYRLKRAEETLDEAEYNAIGGYYNAAVNRLYYACYYAASALMLKYGLDASTHKGIRNQLGLHFITKGIINPRFGSIYSRLFQARQAGDYEDFVFCDQIMYDEYKPQAEDFISEMRSIISKF